MSGRGRSQSSVKLLVFGIGAGRPRSVGLQSPSGHTSAGAVVYGGLLALVLRTRLAATTPPLLLGALCGAVTAFAFGVTRLSVQVALRDGAPTALAGLWEGWRGPGGEVMRTFAIITCEANEKLRALHDRMPVAATHYAAPGVAGRKITLDGGAPLPRDARRKGGSEAARSSCRSPPPWPAPAAGSMARVAAAE
jgi:hypothetical protein